MGIILVVVVVVGCMRSASVGAESSCSKTLGDTTFDKCSYFAQLDSTLSWTYYPANGSMDFGFKAKPPAKGGWVGWGINPTTSGMIGTQALIGFQQANGSLVTMAYNVNTAVGTIPPSAISYPAHNLRSTFESGSITVFATVILPMNKTVVNHTWQVGAAVDGLSVEPHPLGNTNLKSYGPLDIVSAATAPAGSPSSSVAPSTGGGSPSGSPSTGSGSPSTGSGSPSTGSGGSSSSTSPSSSSSSSCKAGAYHLALLILSLSIFAPCFI